MGDLHTEFFLNGLLDLQQPRIAILHDFPGVEVDEMVVLAELVRTFVLGTVMAKLVLDHQIAVQQQLNGVVQGGATNTVLPVFHPVVEVFNIEMPLGAVNLLQDGKALRSLSKIMVMEVFGEYLSDGQRYCFIGFFHI